MRHYKILDKHVEKLNGKDLLQTIGELQESLRDTEKRAENVITEALDEILKGNDVLENKLDFLRALPLGLKKRQVHDEYILKSIPENEWKYYRPQSWVEKHQKVTANETLDNR